MAVEVPGTRKEGSSGFYRSIIYNHGELITIDSNPLFPKTAYEAFEHGLKANPQGNCLGHRPWDPVKGDYHQHYEWQTYETIGRRRDHIGSALLHLAETSLHPENITGWTVGLWCHNRPEWQVVNQATAAYNLVMISLYETLGPAAVEFCTNHSECRVIFASPSHIPHLLNLADKCPLLKVIVSVDNWSDIDALHGGPIVGALSKGKALTEWGASKGIRVLDMAEMELLGATRLKAHLPPKPDDLGSICYTSGTTGNPKGAILTHRLLASCVVAHCHGRVVEKGEVAISYLPLSHIYERFSQDVLLYSGSAIGFSCGDNLRLLEDLAILKPSFMAAVPRVLNRLYQVIKSQTTDAPGLKGALARRAFATKIENLRRDGTVTHAFWDRLMMKKIAGAVGGRLKFIGTGSAAISPAVLEFLQVAFSIHFTEGYGSTENGGTCTKNVLGDYTSLGTVGPPQPTIELKLLDCPELGYLSTDKPFPRGEICCRGEGVIPGYYKDPEKTAESFTDDGFFRTGDIGTVDHLGRFKIIDRVKNLVKLSQGEYVAVEKVENVYSVPSLGQQTFVYADGLQSHLILFVVPDPVNLAALASKVLGKQISPTDQAALQEAAENRKVRDAALAIYTQEAKSRKLQGFETAKQLAFRLTPFSVEEDTLTPTMKIKRNIVNKMMKDKADTLYAEYDKENAGKKTGFAAKL